MKDGKQGPLKLWGGEGPAGTWRVKGQSTEAGNYEGQLTVTACGSLFVCQYDTSADSFIGTGLIHDGRLLVARTKFLRSASDSGESSGSERPGIVWYTQAAIGNLEAVWNSPLIGCQIGTGRSTPSDTGRLTGRREIQYFDALGTQYPRQVLKIEQTGESLQLSWAASDTEPPGLIGAGIETSTGLAAAWGSCCDDAQYTLLEFRPPASDGQPAQGRAVTTGSPHTGMESICRDTV